MASRGRRNQGEIQVAAALGARNYKKKDQRARIDSDGRLKKQSKASKGGGEESDPRNLSLSKTQRQRERKEAP